MSARATAAAPASTSTAAAASAIGSASRRTRPRRPDREDGADLGPPDVGASVRVDAGPAAIEHGAQLALGAGEGAGGAFDADADEAGVAKLIEGQDAGLDLEADGAAEEPHAERDRDFDRADFHLDLRMDVRDRRD